MFGLIREQVGDFGLARWQPDGDLGVQTRVIGTFGYAEYEFKFLLVLMMNMIFKMGQCRNLLDL